MFMQTAKSTLRANRINLNWNIVQLQSHGDSLPTQQLSEIKKNKKIDVPKGYKICEPRKSVG